jgi:plasmid stabilization system protein ParE
VRAAVELAFAAEEDLAQVVDFLFDTSPKSAWRFADEYERTIELLRDFPLVGLERDGYRRLRIGETGYRLVYGIEANLVRVLRIEHAKTPWPFI